VGEAQYRSPTRTREPLPAQAESERIVLMSYVLVVDHERRPCAPVHPGRARHLLNHGRAAVFRRYPFTLILKQGERRDEPMPLRLKIDPGSKTTGLAAVNYATGQVVWAAELSHRGQQVKERLDQRRSRRRSRRSRHTRYRRALSQPSTARWVAPTLPGEPDRQCGNVGQAPASIRARRSTLA
jgi:RRXRR protein